MLDLIHTTSNARRSSALVLMVLGAIACGKTTPTCESGETCVGPTGDAQPGDGDVGGATGSQLGSGGANDGPIVPGSEYCSATTWTVTDGYVDNGTICGHAWTYTLAPGASVAPPCNGGPCFTGTELCISGMLPAADFPSEILFGINTAQERNAGGPGYFALGGSGVTVDFTRGGFDGEVRLILDTGERYCASLTSGEKLMWSDFSVGCSEEGPRPPEFEPGTEVRAFLFQLNNAEEDQSFSNFCVQRITVHP